MYKLQVVTFSNVEKYWKVDSPSRKGDINLIYNQPIIIVNLKINNVIDKQ